MAILVGDTSGLAQGITALGQAVGKGLEKRNERLEKSRILTGQRTNLANVLRSQLDLPENQITELVNAVGPGFTASDALKFAQEGRERTIQSGLLDVLSGDQQAQPQPRETTLASVLEETAPGAGAGDGSFFDQTLAGIGETGGFSGFGQPVAVTDQPIQGIDPRLPSDTLVSESAQAQPVQVPTPQPGQQTSKRSGSSAIFDPRVVAGLGSKNPGTRETAKAVLDQEQKQIQIQREDAREESKQKSSNNKLFYQINKDLFARVDDIRSKIDLDTVELARAEQLFKENDFGPTSLDSWADFLPESAARLIRSGQRNEAENLLKNQLIAGFSGISGKGLNQFIEKKVANSLARVGADKVSNLNWFAAKRFSNRVKIAETDAADRLEQQYLDAGGLQTPRRLAPQIEKEKKAAVEDARNALAYDIQRNEQLEIPFNKIDLKTIPKGSPITKKTLQKINMEHTSQIKDLDKKREALNKIMADKGWYRPDSQTLRRWEVDE